MNQAFNITSQRLALQTRWESPQYRRDVLTHFAVMELTMGASPIAADETSRDGGAAKGAASIPSAFRSEVASKVESLKSFFQEKAFRDTIVFATFDLPKNARGLLNWIQLLVDEKENSPQVQKQLKEAFPGMKTHPDTENNMHEIILPFRSFVLMTVVQQLLADSSLGAAVASGKPVEWPTEAKHPYFPCFIHAAHHAKDIEDVYDILQLKAYAELESHIARRAADNLCVRFARYCQLQLVPPGPERNDEWEAELVELAEMGLAFAQNMVGRHMLEVRKHAEGIMWLERAAAQGCTSAMLSVGSVHAYVAIRYMERDLATPAGVVSQRAHGVFQYLVGDSGNETGVSAKVTEARITAEVKKATVLLSTLIDTQWEADTPLDTAEGKDTLFSLEAKVDEWKVGRARRRSGTRVRCWTNLWGLDRLIALLAVVSVAASIWMS